MSEHFQQSVEYLLKIRAFLYSFDYYFQYSCGLTVLHTDRLFYSFFVDIFTLFFGDLEDNFSKYPLLT